MDRVGRRCDLVSGDQVGEERMGDSREYGQNGCYDQRFEKCKALRYGVVAVAHVPLTLKLSGDQMLAGFLGRACGNVAPLFIGNSPLDSCLMYSY